MRDRGVSWRKVLILAVAALIGMGAWGIDAGQQAQAGLAISHFKCYETTSKPLNEQVRLFDRFHDGAPSPSTGGELVTVKGSHLVCTQVAAKCFPGGGCEQPFRVFPLSQGVNCYKITPSGPPVGETVHAVDQLAEQNLTVGTAQFLCTPFRSGEGG